MNARLVSLFREYEDCHRHPVNRAIHKLCVPAILFHVLAMLDWVQLTRLSWMGDFRLSLGQLAFLFVLAWYFTLDSFLALLLGLFGALCLVVAPLVPVPVVIGIAVVAWVLQFVGHGRFEKRRPAFAREPLQLLVGPLFVFALFCGKWGRPETQDMIGSS